MGTGMGAQANEPHPPGKLEPDLAGWQAVEELYHAFLTGMILTVVTRRSAADAAELVFRTFRRQHLEKFLPGLELLGLRGLPHAVACAQYHYLSNLVGGVRVEYMPESARKAWVRYVPPRWIFDGTAICAIPTEVSRAMLRAWHAHNGVSLGNPRLGFVCTGQTVDGQPGLEGYYLEHDRDLAPEERLRYAPGESSPDFDPALAPRLPSVDWPPERLAKVRRNYALEYTRSLLPELMALWGPAQGGHLAGITGKLIGMQYHARMASLLGIAGRTAEDFARLWVRLLTAQGERADWSAGTNHGADSVSVRLYSWRLLESAGPQPPEAFDGWSQLGHGLLAVHNRRLRMELRQRADAGDPCWEWAIRGAGAGA